MTPAVAVRLRSADETRALGERLGEAATAGDRFLLEGDFGAGKTTLVQGLAAGLGVSEPVASPSFVIQNRYAGRLRLHHVDLYRLERLDDAFLAGLEEDLFDGSVAAVEWPTGLPADLAAGATCVRLSVQPDGTRVAEVASPESRLLDAARAAAGVGAGGGG